MYTIATGVGVMRVLNNKHWASDVLAGAGFGILSTELTYFLLTPKVKHSKALSAEAISSLYTTALIKTNP
jgi:membrane-associated phospholipid phosphatase